MARNDEDSNRAAAAEQRLQSSDRTNRSDVTQRTQRTQRTDRDGDAPVPRRPDERDESVDSQASQTLDAQTAEGNAPRAVLQRAHVDLAVGQVDTDQHSRAADGLMRRLQEQGTPEHSTPEPEHSAHDDTAHDDSAPAHNSNPHAMEAGK